MWNSCDIPIYSIFDNTTIYTNMKLMYTVSISHGLLDVGNFTHACTFAPTLKLYSYTNLRFHVLSFFMHASENYSPKRGKEHENEQKANGGQRSR